MGGGLLIGPTAGAAGDPHSRSVCRAKPVYSGPSYGNYSARAQPGIARTQNAVICNTRALVDRHWIACRPGFFLSVQVLSRLFRRLFLERLTAAYQAGYLEFF